MKSIFRLALFVIASVSLATAQGTYTQIDVPGSSQTFCFGLNNSGAVVGRFLDAFGVTHGFLLDGGTFTTLDDPGSTFTAAYGINDIDQVVGTNGSFGFLYDAQTQIYTPIEYQSQLYYTLPLSINNAGVIAGYVAVAGTGKDSGFEGPNGAFRAVIPKGSTVSDVSGINNVNVAVGSANFGQNASSNFLFSGGRFTRLNIPANRAVVAGLNDYGSIVGTFITPGGGSIQGFWYENSTIQIIRFPGSSDTIPYGINNSGEIVGYFIDSTGTHGFSWIASTDSTSN